MIDTFNRLVRKWVHPDYLPIPVQRSALEKIEYRFYSQLPANYCECMEKIGPPSFTISLLSSIIDQRLNVRALHEFFTPAMVIETTAHARLGGLARDLIAFASEGSGDYFCFKTRDPMDDRRLDANVWYFDHEERTSRSLRTSFSDWVEIYAQIDGVPRPPVDSE
jgi:SMI1-KNR4 cell-wall